MLTSEIPDRSSDAGASLPLILASASPRRHELMTRFWPGRLQVMTPPFDETAVLRGYTDRSSRQDGAGTGFARLEQLTQALTAGKIAALQAHFVLPAVYCAVAADTLVLIDDQVLGKPADAAEAASHLRLLSGRTHRVVTGLCLHVQQQDAAHQLQATEETEVCFAPLDDAMIDWYIRTGEPFDKAGSYGIQGFGAALVRRIDGCYYNVMGLPVHRLMVLLRQAAIHIISDPASSHLLPWS